MNPLILWQLFLSLSLKVKSGAFMFYVLFYFMGLMLFYLLEHLANNFNFRPYWFHLLTFDAQDPCTYLCTELAAAQMHYGLR